MMRLRDACLVLLVLWVPAAWAQHGMPTPARPLHVRLAEADAVALGTVERVETGRIDVMGALAVRGEPGERFRVKRSPAHPPGLAAGERVLFLLRGARTPYLLVDEPREILKLTSSADEERWRRALSDLLGVESLEAKRDTYLGWIDGDDDALRAAAIQALADRSRPLPVPPELARQRARIALDPARPAEARRASASIACQDPAGTAMLLAGLGDPQVDLEVLQLGLGFAALQRAPGLGPTLVAVLRSGDPERVEAAIPAARFSTGVPAVRAELERIAAEGANDELRAAAAHALKRAR